MWKAPLASQNSFIHSQRVRKSLYWPASAVYMALAGALLAGCSGCATPPPWELEDASEIEFVCTNAPATEVECPTP